MYSLFPSIWKSRTSLRGFTLIELLIVIAIILILIAIALPNFLEAQERARVARGKGHLRSIETGALAHYTQYGFLYSDYDDPSPVIRKTRNKNSSIMTLPCPINPPAIYSKGGVLFYDDPSNAVGNFQRKFYSPQIHCPLTTPIRFVDPDTLVDPWSDGSIPVGYCSRYDTLGTGSGPSFDNPRFIQYGAYFVSGPDKIAGSWLHNFAGAGGCAGNSGKALAYSPTNGTRSCGELWVVVTTSTAYARNEIDPLNSF
jgi:prepilin-type N-terminal cleavage/methylation domain-containing protein